MSNLNKVLCFRFVLITTFAFLIGGFFVFNTANACYGEEVCSPTVSSSSFDQVNKTVTYTFSEPIQFVSQSNPETIIKDTTGLSGLVNIYTAYSYEHRNIGDLEPTHWAASATLSTDSTSLSITYTDNLPAGTYLADTWGYTVTDLAENKLVESTNILFIVVAPTLDSATITDSGNQIGTLSAGSAVATVKTGTTGADHVININSDSVSVSNGPIDNRDYVFNLEASVDQQAKLKSYFGAKGWPTESGYLTQIEEEIEGKTPFFYFRVAGTTDAKTYSLVDGFKYSHGLTDANVVIDDDYPTGDYVFKGTIAGTEYTITLKVEKPDIVYVDDDYTLENHGSYIWGGNAFTNIKDAIDKVKDGGTVNVATGTYAEKLTISKPITLQGAGASATTIDGGGLGTVINITVDNVKVDGFTIQNSGVADSDAGIFLGKITGIGTGTGIIKSIITNNIITTNNGIILAFSSNNTIKSNTLTGSGYGIVLGASSNNNVESNIISNSNSGSIYLDNQSAFGGSVYNEGSTGNNIKKNEISYSSKGESLNLGENCNGNSITDNTISGGLSGGSYGIHIWKSDNQTITGNIIKNFTLQPKDGYSAVAIRLRNANNNNITGNKITDNMKGFEVVAYSTDPRGLSSGNVINNNNISGNGSAIDVVAGNTVDATKNYWGSALKSTIESKISGTVDFEPYYVDSDKSILSNEAPTTVYVGKNYAEGSSDGHIFGYDAFTNIKDAIDKVKDGGTVNVATGTYAEKLTISKPITLQGVEADKATTIIDGGSTSGIVITITANNVTVKNLTISQTGASNINTDAGIGLIGSTSSITNTKIENNIITGNVTGIALMGASNSTITDNTINNSLRYGVVLEVSPYNEALFSTGNTISENNMTANARDGIYVGQGCNINKIIDNEISGATGTDETSITGNGFEANGIYFWKSSSNEVTGNTISGNVNYGIEMMGSSNNEITGNTITGNKEGLRIRNTEAPGYSIKGNTISNNKIYNNSRVNLYTDANESTEFSATENWWGTADENKVAKTIAGYGYDRTSDIPTILGTLDFITYLPLCLDEDCETTGNGVSPIVTIAGISDTVVGSISNFASSNNNTHSVTLWTTNKALQADSHYLSFVSGTNSNENLKDIYYPLILTKSEIVDGDDSLENYYTNRGTPYPWLSYLVNAANKGGNPFAYIKVVDGTSLQLIDAAKHDLGNKVDVAMEVPDNFPRGEYTLEGVVKDEAENETKITFVLTVDGDREAPTGTISINSGAEYTNNKNVTLTLSASDPSNVAYMRLMNDGGYDDAIPYTTSYSWPLSTTSGDGEKTVYVKYIDIYGNEMKTGVSDEIVLDTTAPVITAPESFSQEATGIKNTVVLGNATATDLFDSSVTISNDAPSSFGVGTTTVTWIAEDDAGNKSTATQTITVIDTIAPLITLIGDEEITLEIHTPYTDAGATATDIVDNDLTGSINTINSVDIDHAGTYTVTYNVKDSLKNEAIEIIRTVIVKDSINEAFREISTGLSDEGITSNLSEVTTDNITSFSGLYFEKGKIGKITFNSLLNLSDTNTQNFLQNLNDKLDISSEYISLDARTVTDLKNAKASIKMYTLPKGLDLSKISLTVKDENGNILGNVASDINYQDLGVCSVDTGICSIFSFNTEHFTSFEAKVVEQEQTVPETNEDGSGTATVDNKTPEVIITNPTQTITVDVSNGTTGASVNFDALITGGTGTIPETTINTEKAKVEIPASTKVTSADSSWNGVMEVPTVTTITLPKTSGETKTLSTAIEVGFAGAKLSFDKAVSILLPGQAGKRAGYTRTGTAFTEITTICPADDSTIDSFLTGGKEECKKDVGSNLVIWTKHFTTFATYTQTRNHSLSGSRAIPATPAVLTVNPAISATPAEGQVLGVEKYNFTLLMKKGTRGNEIKELQSLLNTAGYDCGIADGIFGLKTKAAVIKFQIANKLKGDGIIGPLTRAVLNK